MSLQTDYFRHPRGYTTTMIKTGIAYLLMALVMSLGVLLVGRSNGRLAPGEQRPKKK